MIIGKNTLPSMVLTLDRGIKINSNWDQSVEVRCRIEKARPVFNKMKIFFVSRNLRLKLKIRMVRYYILPVLLYGVEAWTMTEALIAHLMDRAHN